MHEIGGGLDRDVDRVMLLMWLSCGEERLN